MTGPGKREALPVDSWQVFVEAKRLADRSGARVDIELAARAWTNWLTDFIPSAAERLTVPLPRFQRGHQ
jgi:hypothetical protein